MHCCRRSGDDSRRGLERRFRHGEFRISIPSSGSCAGRRSGAPPPPTIRSAHPGTPASRARGTPSGERLGDGRRGSEQDGRVPADGTVDEDRRGGPQRAQLTVQAARRDDDEPVDLLRQRPDRSNLFVRVLAGVHEEHLQISAAGRPLHRSHQRREVRVRDIGNDHCDIARTPGDQPAGGAVGHEAEIPHRFFDAKPGCGGDLLGDVDRARHRCRVHPGALGNVQDRGSLLALHDARPYTETSADRGDR